MKKVLVIGSSKGIGLACAQHFNNLGHSVLTVSRTGSPTYCGDITNADFRNFLINTVSPDVVILSAGSYVNNNNMFDMANINFSAALEIIAGFYKKLPNGSDIINISSMASTNSLTPIDINYNAYSASKAGISDFCIAIGKFRTRDIRVTTVEPMDVWPTDLAPKTRTVVSSERYINFNWNTVTPMTPDYIASVCEWVINQPRWVSVSRITLNNNYSRHAISS